MAKLAKMAALGRRGGLLGGPARARSLGSRRRKAIATKAAVSRWAKPVLVMDRLPRGRGELLSLVANYGASVAKGRIVSGLERVVLQAVKASRRDMALARMVPVFLWRVRDDLDLVALVTRARKVKCAATLGYFLELAGHLGAFTGFDDAVRQLRIDARP
ncbi:MAG TPA: hypothetical protein VFH73_07700, partial [Polyangia bacterium]|nr:hypothetical protein [Polyangia bacterium]